ncbi:FAD:protein FMN transferase [Brevibacillus choshinensis]|uniref:FAD:protein FMN transferase n=1 Tax=Brevibacillus choshinensis TaxID=54911 RepID=A0ABX7FP98_BRECH|nr:FAD:protein FMN transferase [Brevibacillus choshinensis]QRG68056.1 FAD:protein FMN transferase [Brevibacillus choshinensis]
MQPEVPLHVYRSRAMNTEIEVIWESQALRKSRALEKIADKWFHAVEQRFSRFMPDSELSYLNRQSGSLTLISGAMAEVLSLAEIFHIQTEGMFSPFVYDALHAAGYSQSYDIVKQADAVTSDSSCSGAYSMTLHSGMKAVQLQDGTHLDLGGIVKGWSAEKMADKLRLAYGVRRGLVNAGGDVQVWGGSSAQEPWRIGIASPWHPEEELAMVSLRDGAVATSSSWGRRWNHAKHGVQHHLIDPRTMRPGSSDVIQCSIAGDSLISCEIWAKVVCLFGLERGLALLQTKCPRMEALIVSETGDLHLLRRHPQEKERWETEHIDFIHEKAN